MKNFLISTFVAAMCVGSGSLYASSALQSANESGKIPVTISSKTGPAKGFSKKEITDASTSLQRKLSSKAVSRNADEEVYSINLTYGDMGDLQLNSLFYAGPNYSSWEWAGDEEEIVVMGGGEYTIAAIFHSPVEDEPLRIVVKENIEVNEDIDLFIDPATSINRITFAPTLPSGDLIQGPILDERWNLLENGNISSDIPTYVKSVFGSRKYGPAVVCETNFNRIKNSDGNVLEGHNFADFFINPGLSDDIECNQVCCFASLDNSTVMLTHLRSNGSATQTIGYSNNPWAWTDYNQIFTKKGFPKDIEIVGDIISFDWYETDKGIPQTIIQFQGEEVNKATKLAYNLESDKLDIPVFEAIPRVMIFQLGVPYEKDDFTWQDWNPIYTSVMRQNGDQMEIISNPMIGDIYNNEFLFDEKGVNVEVALWGNPAFSSLPGIDPQVAGDNTPFVQYIDKTTALYLGINWLELGRVSENVELTPFDKFYYWFNGREMKGAYIENYEDYIEFSNYINENLEGYKGKVITEISYEKGMEVDGITAKSYAHAIYDRSQSEDINVPQLTMLQFRNSDGLVTDRFDTASDGVLTFSAADFEHIFDPYYDDSGNIVGILEWYKFISTPSVKVEYSPLDADDWHEIEVTEDPAKFIATAYGSYFSGSLAHVTEKAMHGWFDLKITLSDEGGNSLETFVSPAFKIKDLAGVSNLKGDAIKEVKEIYNMQGLRVASAQPGEVIIERLSDGTTRKRIVE